ncbi:pimeloyl-ACP methyl ester carboxylesterase [Acinetobacter calcoaceticus]|uniref:Pimeloyl-ACP methyl ester carboxylesterase n=1 Tax=Acinetobacter calcoaceticus TaxID=471 RepID=A0A4R1XQA5_ACICA|nr:pimeloyl-ACP methyl ester carboxylesterase [Acinetobacter calcoaceticus]
MLSTSRDLGHIFYHFVEICEKYRMISINYLLMIIMLSKNTIKMLLLMTTAPLLYTGCQVVSVKNQALNVSIANERDSILTRNKMSEASLNVLSMTGSEAKSCTEDPDDCVSKLQKIPQILDEQLLSTASEIYLSKAIALGSSSACKTSVLSKHRSEERLLEQQQNYNQCLDQHMQMLDKSLRYSYAYLFDTKRQPQDRIFDNRQVQIRDFYNQALAKLVSSYSLRYKDEKISTEIKVGDSIYKLNAKNYPQLEGQDIQNFLSSYNLNFSGLRSTNRRDGFGAEFVAILPSSEKEEEGKYIIDPLHYPYKNGVNPNIHSAQYLPVTIAAEPQTAQSIEQIIKSPEIRLDIYDPFNTESLKIAAQDYPLAANFSAPYGLWLAENNLGAAAYLSLIDRDQHLTMPHLYMLEPYNPNKKVIVLVHGLASSPEAWIRLTNDIMGDQVLREHYQVWQVFYSTNMPILESRFQVNAIIKQAFATLDPKAPAAKDAVLIGHSMGGIIARLLVSDADLTKQALKVLNPRQISKFKNNEIFTQRLSIQPIQNFDRAIFLAAPHRGTAFADRWFTKLARRIIKLPVAFVGALADTVEDKDLDLKHFIDQMGQGIIQNGPSDLSHNSKFTDLTEDVVPKKGMKFHSIMGNHTDSTDLDVISDGVVPYRSAHLDGAVSEKIIKGGHSIQETPEAVLELRRILRLHLTELGLYTPTPLK